MAFFIISLVLHAIGSNAVLIDPTSSDEYISVQLTDDSRGLNEINSDNEWVIKDQTSDPLNDWALELDLDAEEYSFKSGVDGSSISIEMDLYKGSSECDAHFAFSIGNDEYFTFMVDLDNAYNINYGSGKGDRSGIFIYPECGSTAIASGDASTIMSSIPSSNNYYVSVREELCGGDQDNCHKLTSSQNGANYPISFEIINNDLSDTFTFIFSSPTFKGDNVLNCTYDTSLDTEEDFKLYMSPDASNLEIIMIESFEIDGVSTGYTPSPTTAQPTTAEPTTGNPTTSNPTTSNPTTANPTTSNPTTSNPTTSVPTTAAPTTSNPTTSTPTTAAPTTLEPTNDPTLEPTLDGCDFDIDAYLEQCYCSDDDDGQIESQFSNRNNRKNDIYNNGHYTDNYDNNGDNLKYFHVLLDLIILVILVVIIIYLNYIMNEWKSFKKGYGVFDDDNCEKNAIKNF